MWIETEPGDMLMVRYKLCFRKDTPNPEDGPIRALLREHNLSPKRRWTDEREGVRFEVLQYGQCYLGHALQVIVGMQQRGMVAESVAYSLDTEPELAALAGGVDDARRADLAWTVAGAVLDGEAIGPAPDDPERSMIDPHFLREAIRNAVADLQAAATP
jgi:hypothetical protein